MRRVLEYLYLKKKVTWLMSVYHLYLEADREEYQETMCLKVGIPGSNEKRKKLRRLQALFYLIVFVATTLIIMATNAEKFYLSGTYQNVERCLNAVKDAGFRAQGNVRSHWINPGSNKMTLQQLADQYNCDLKPVKGIVSRFQKTTYLLKGKRSHINSMVSLLNSLDKRPFAGCIKRAGNTLAITVTKSFQDEVLKENAKDFGVTLEQL